MKQIKNLCIITIFVLVATACGNKIKTETSAQEGLKIRDEYPFLNDPNCDFFL